jgi:hypothetical protein
VGTIRALIPHFLRHFEPFHRVNQASIASALVLPTLYQHFTDIRRFLSPLQNLKSLNGKALGKLAEGVVSEPFLPSFNHGHKARFATFWQSKMAIGQVAVG